MPSAPAKPAAPPRAPTDHPCQVGARRRATGPARARRSPAPQRRPRRREPAGVRDDHVSHLAQAAPGIRRAVRRVGSRARDPHRVRRRQRRAQDYARCAVRLADPAPASARGRRSGRGTRGGRSGSSASRAHCDLHSGPCTGRSAPGPGTVAPDATGLGAAASRVQLSFQRTGHRHSTDSEMHVAGKRKQLRARSRTVALATDRALASSRPRPRELGPGRVGMPAEHRQFPGSDPTTRQPRERARLTDDVRGSSALDARDHLRLRVLRPHRRSGRRRVA